VHEVPFMSPKTNDLLQENNVITVEPGMYIPGWGGVRIEDDVLITKDGAVVLHKTHHELIVL
jgi:Xaa-Pro aminopeptidase